MIFALTLSFKASSSNGITTLMPFSSLRDHPRGCGAHFVVNRSNGLYTGSSPRVRGSLDGSQFAKLGVGIIPAGAGLTFLLVSRLRRNGDHPRGCGAHFPLPFFDLCKRGSSPRVRGSHGTESVFVVVAGIIPAGAGLTPKQTASRLTFGDHPRGCGAHQPSLGRIVAEPGSSPRVRGSPLTGLVVIDCAWDHPRGCGAHWQR